MVMIYVYGLATGALLTWFGCLVWIWHRRRRYRAFQAARALFMAGLVETMPRQTPDPLEEMGYRGER